MRSGTANVLAAALAGVLATPVSAGETPSYGPIPSWVHTWPVPADLKPTGAAVDVLLFNSQERMTPGADESFAEIATRVNAPEGLATLGNLIETWDPRDPISGHPSGADYPGRKINRPAGRREGLHGHKARNES